MPGPAGAVLHRRNESPPARTRTHLLARPLVAAVVLLACYFAASTLNNPRGFLGTDTGAKVATLRVMDAHDTFEPNAGYWAAADDPQGRVHPLYDTVRVGDKYVAVTTLPMLLLARPLWALGGMRLALLIPMLGGVATALAGLALARRLGSRHPMTVFWIVGLASPTFVYALDLWEHSIGLALMAWGVVLLFDTWSGRAGWKGALAAGALFGAAASMRTEALLYGAVATAVVALGIVVRDRSLRRAIPIGAASFVGVAALWLANDRLERAVLGGSLRASRAASTAGAAGSDFSTRAGEALRTAVGMNYAAISVEALAGVCFFVALAGAAWLLGTGRGTTRQRVELIGAAAILLFVRLHAGIAFMSGLVPALPVAAFGVVLAWRDRSSRLLALIAVVSLPGVWMVQYTGGAGPQWGGRYILLTGLLLAVVGIVATESLPRWSRLVALGLCVVVTAAGVRYVGIRTNQGAGYADTVAGLPDDLVISRYPHLFREAGARYDEQRHWLTAVYSPEVRKAAAVARETHARSVAVIVIPGWKTHLDGYREVGRPRQFTFFSERLLIRQFVRAP